MIFLKLGVIEIIYNAQRVCSLWRKLAKEPQLFRCIDMRNPWKYFDPCNFDPFRRMARKAMIRSRGQLEEISMEYFGTDEHIYRAIGKSKARSLRAIRLVSCYQVSDEALIDIAKENPLLEELELIFCSFMTETVATVGQYCPQLKSLRINRRGCIYSDPAVAYNEDAFAIAANMPQLRRLHLFGNNMNNKGLQAILDGCPHLEYLDLRQCFTIDLKGDLLKKCSDRITDLRLPNDSTRGYGYDTSIYRS